MVPRLLGEYLPDTVRKHMPYADTNLSYAALNFLPFGHFHVMSQEQIRTTVMDSSNSNDADSHGLRLSQNQEETLGPLIGVSTLEGVLMLAHGMAGYVKEVQDILESCSACRFAQGETDYQATLCHHGKA